MVGTMSAIDILFQLHSFLIHVYIFTFSFISFEISALLFCYLYEKCIVILLGLQHILVFFNLKIILYRLKFGLFLYFARLVNLLAD